MLKTQKDFVTEDLSFKTKSSLLFNLGVKKTLLAFVISFLLSLRVTKLQIYRSFYNSRFKMFET